MKRFSAMSVWLAVLLALLLPVTVSANAAEPPGMIVIATDLPADAQITLEVPDLDEEQEIRTFRVDKMWESHYKIYYHLEMRQLENAVLRVQTEEKSFTCSLPDGVDDGYKNILTLDYVNQSLTLGQNFWRQPLLTLMRISLTLLIEGAVFWLFGFRSKRSWIVFLVVNLLTQGWLNIVVNSYAFSSGYWTLAYILMEYLIFAGEMIAMSLAIRERKKWICVVYALAANAASLAAGIYFIGHMPL